MAEITVLAESGRTVEGRWRGDRATVPATALPAAIGWELKPEGLCRADVCVPVADRAALEVDGMYDLVRVAEALDRPALADPTAGIVAIGLPSADRRAALRDRLAPDFELHDLAGVPHTLGGWTGKKRLLVAFSSW